MSVWVELEQERDTFITTVRSLYHYSPFADELKLSPLTHWVRVTHLATGWNRNMNSLLSGIIEDLCSILLLELNKKEMSYLVWQYKLLPCLPWQAPTTAYLQRTHSWLACQVWRFIYFALDLADRKGLMLFFFFLYRDVLKRGKRRTWI